MNSDHAQRFGYPAMEKAPPLSAGPLAWLKRNLFSNAFNAGLTLALAAVLLWLASRAARWAVQEARWGVITSNVRVIVWGRYPQEELWRPESGLLLLLGLAVLSGIVWSRPRLRPFRRSLLVVWALSPIVLGVLLSGLELPTLRTIGNNLGYYVFRPDLLPVLDAQWRGPAALFLVALAAAWTWTWDTRRLTRLVCLSTLILFLGLNLPSALTILPGPAGVPLPWAVPIAFAVGAGWLAGAAIARRFGALPRARRWLTLLWLLVLAGALLTLTDFSVGRPEFDPVDVLAPVQPSLWSGIMLTLVLTAVTILLSFPLGVLLALGRTSRLPVVRVACVTLIEVVRGVPLITILFMAQVMLPMFLPIGFSIDRVVRAIAGMTIFTAAYLAEVVRGGLQAVPREQLEAARALGLSELLVTVLVLLPQALRLVIPAIMGQFVSIFKDTSLIAIVGLLELLGILNSITKQREFLGTVREVYLFAAAFYFLISYGMSVASRRVEARLGVGTR
jgi:general L-amino acid transport system permease protein